MGALKELAGLEAVIGRTRTALGRLTAKRDSLKQNIESLSRSIRHLEARGSRVIALLEYRAMRLEIRRSYKELANCKVEVRNLEESLKGLCRDLCSTQESLRNLQKPKSLP